MLFERFIAAFLYFSAEIVFSDQLSSQDDLGRIVVANVVFRHGHRTPTASYPTDPYKNLSFWPEGWGQLTNTGKAQEFELGQWLKQRFQKLLSDTYSRDEIFILSTDVDRTLMSAEANLAGLYPPDGSQQWNKNIKWQPIPVHTVPERLDKVLAMKAPCPRYAFEFKKMLNLPAVMDLLAQYKDLMEYLSNHTGEKVGDLVKVQSLHSTMFIETLHNYTLPEWTKKSYPEPMRTAADYLYVLQTYSTELKRLKSGPLLKDMLSHFKAKLMEESSDMSNETKEIKKKNVWLYSAHDDTVGSLMNSLGVYNFINPPFASALLIELREKEQKHFITVTYRNSTTESPHLLAIPGCSEFCPYEMFLQLTAGIVPNDWDMECKLNRLLDLTSELPYSSLAVFVIVTSTVLVFLLLASMSIFWRNQKPTRFYRKLKTDSI